MCVLGLDCNGHEDWTPLLRSFQSGELQVQKLIWCMGAKMCLSRALWPSPISVCHTGNPDCTLPPLLHPKGCCLLKESFAKRFSLHFPQCFSVPLEQSSQGYPPHANPPLPGNVLKRKEKKAFPHEPCVLRSPVNGAKWLCCMQLLQIAQLTVLAYLVKTILCHIPIFFFLISQKTFLGFSLLTSKLSSWKCILEAQRSWTELGSLCCKLNLQRAERRVFFPVVRYAILAGLRTCRSHYLLPSCVLAPGFNT